MKLTKKLLPGLMLIFFFTFALNTAWANDIKQRMKQRLPVINQMKQQGLVGENANGYLEFVSAKKMNGNIVTAENKDRKTVYSIIAKQQGANIQTVEQRRAFQIIQRTHKGEYLKKANGTWYKK